MGVDMQIKGIKDGILVRLEMDEWDSQRKELIDQIDAQATFFKGAKLALDVGEQVLHAIDLGQLREELSEKGITLWAVLSESSITCETAIMYGLSTQLQAPRVSSTRNSGGLSIEGEPALLIAKTLRSGNKIMTKGHVVIIGDVNPGAEIIASGSVVVWGKLRGFVHAGAEGDEKAVICALDLSPTQIRIAGKVATAPKRKGKPQAEVVKIQDDRVVAESWRNKGRL